MSHKTTLTGLAVVLALAAGVWIGTAVAKGVPSESALTYGGVVTDTDGKPPAAATDVLVTFYDAVSGGAAVCASAKTQAAAGSGRFSITLPKACADAVHAKQNLWSEVAVGPAQTKLPRQRIGAVPYALEAQGAVVAADVDCKGCVGVAKMKFDADVDLGGKALKAGSVDFGPGAGDELDSAKVKTLTGGGNADALHTHAGLGSGGGGATIKFHGITSASFQSDPKGGYHVFTNACAQQYGASRICSTEMIERMFPEPRPQATAWLFGSGNNPNGWSLRFAPSGAINCAGSNGSPFTLSSGYGGRAMTPDGAIESKPCVGTSLPVMCCGL
ncbi:MAG: hypothetical protein H6747_13040 [Deltaproteobacteria bacterium]|nr:hypothetical protein [Deltaproteobacteria bacterium]